MMARRNCRRFTFKALFPIHRLRDQRLVLAQEATSRQHSTARVAATRFLCKLGRRSPETLLFLQKAATTRTGLSSAPAPPIPVFLPKERVSPRAMRVCPPF